MCDQKNPKFSQISVFRSTILVEICQENCDKLESFDLNKDLAFEI